MIKIIGVNIMIYNSLRYVVKTNSDVDNCDLVIYSPRTLSDIDDIPCFLSADEYNKYFKDTGGIYETERKQSDLDEKTKFFKRVSRSRNMIRDISYNNQFKYFYTQTFDHNKYSVYNENLLHDEFIRGYLKDYIKYRNNRYNSDMAYIIIPDVHKDGAYHYHGLVRGDWDLIKYSTDMPDFEKLPGYIRRKVLKGEDVFIIHHCKPDLVGIPLDI